MLSFLFSWSIPQPCFSKQMLIQDRCSINYICGWSLKNDQKDQGASWCNGGARKSQLSYKLSGVAYLDVDKRFCNISKSNIAVQHCARLGKSKNKIKNRILRAADVRCQTIKSLCQLASDFQCDWCKKKTWKKTALKTFTPKRLKGQGKISLVNFAIDKKW